MLNQAITTTEGYNLLNGQNSYIYSSQEAIYSPYFGEVSKSMYDCATGSAPAHKTCGNEAELALSQSARQLGAAWPALHLHAGSRRTGRAGRQATWC